MPRSTKVSTNTDLVFEYLDSVNGDQERLGELWGVSRQQIAKMLNGEKVGWRSIEKIAKNCPTLSVSQLIVHDPNNKIANDPRFFESMKLAYFIDNDRRRTGKPTWFWEQVTLKRTKNSNSKFTGKMKNCFGGVFSIEGQWLNRFHFFLRATQDLYSGSYPECFIASFSLVVEDVLCGTWSGIDHADHLAVYRMFMTPRVLGIRDLRQLCRDVRTQTFLGQNVFNIPLTDIPLERTQ